jgi:hypothetical protein
VFFIWFYIYLRKNRGTCGLDKKNLWIKKLGTKNTLAEEKDFEKIK